MASPDRLRAYRTLTRLMDEAIPIPGTRFRVGLDGLIGLVPGVGDLAGAVIAAYGPILGATLGAPPSVLLRMLLNIGIDTLVGMIPLVGDLFDFGWKANSRNRRLLEQFLAEPHAARRASRWVVGGVTVGLVALLGAGAWAGFWVVKEIWRVVTSR